MLKSVIKFARVRIIATCFGLVFLGSLAAGDITWKTALALVLMIAFTIHANSINDYADKDIDKINLKGASDRPLLSGDISSSQFWLIHCASGALMLLLSMFYGAEAVLLTALVLLIDYIYSLKPLRVTDRTLLSPVLLAFTYTYYSFSLGYWAVEVPSHAFPWMLTVGLCLGFMARLLLKDFRDVNGDKKHGKITFLIRFGQIKTTLASAVLWFAAMVAVAYAFSFAIGIVVPSAIGAIMIFAWLYRLSRAHVNDQQQTLVLFIARVANIAIIVILTYLLCWDRPELTTLEAQLLPLITGVILLATAWSRYIAVRRPLHD